MEGVTSEGRGQFLEKYKIFIFEWNFLLKQCTIVLSQIICPVFLR
jgi:hypothetical protein